MTDFSVLMPVYYKEVPEYLNQCLESLVVQTYPATEIVIVKDGLLSEELEKVLSVWQDKLPLKIVGYEENKGIIFALNFGFQFCSYELVARMDSDDICLPDRFEKQIEYFNKNTDVVLLSGYISEFNNKPNDIYSIRKVPVGNSSIIKYLKTRSAFNHPSVMYKKSAVFAVGSYTGVDGLEDHDLWIRIVHSGYKVDNLREILVYVRIGNNMISRRHGLSYAKKEINFFYRQKCNSFLTTPEFIKALLLRIPMRFIPSKILKFIYLKYLRN